MHASSQGLRQTTNQTPEAALACLPYGMSEIARGPLVLHTWQPPRNKTATLCVFAMMCSLEGCLPAALVQLSLPKRCPDVGRSILARPNKALWKYAPLPWARWLRNTEVVDMFEGLPLAWYASPALIAALHCSIVVFTERRVSQPSLITRFGE